MQHFEHKGHDYSSKNGGAGSEIVTVINNISNYLQNSLRHEKIYNPNLLTLSGPT